MLIGGGHYFILRLYFDNFCQFDEGQGKYTGKTSQVETKPFCTQEALFIKILVNATELKT